MKAIATTLLLVQGFFSVGQDHKVVQIPLPKKAKYSSSQCEPSIAIHPKKPKIMIAGSVLDDYYYSKNGGKTWKSKTLTSPYGVWGDPVVIFDTTGRPYYFHLSSYKETSHLDRIVCQSADKICKKFDEGTFPKPNGTKVQDKHWVVVNQENNELYMTWTQFDAYNSADVNDTSIIVFSKSTDQGKTWSDPLRISKYGGDCLDDDETVEGAVPAVGPNGEIYVTWTGPNGLVMQKSLDGGETWLPEEKSLERQWGGWTLDIPGMGRANGLPILKCDLSDGPNRGTLYLNWCDQRNGVEDTDVFIMKSTDGGETWSKVIKVNQDDSQKHQFFTWMDIDPSTGYLYFVYYDRRSYSGNQTDVYMSVSKDGGQTFVDTKLSKTPFVPTEGVFFGDYLNIAALDGVIRPIWPRMDDGHITLWVALIEED